MGWSDSPIVRIGRNGEWFELGRSPDASPALHLWGSEGLGLAPVDIAKSDRITSDGSIVRGVRLADREVFLPLLLEADSVIELNAIRQRMYDLMAPDLGPVEIQIEIPTGGGQEPMLRSTFGYLTEGLDGKFGEDYHGTWQRMGLTFMCPDPWWLGPEQTVELRVNPGSKPFLSDTVPFFPVVLAQSTVQGRFDVTIEGDGPVWPAWEVLGPGTDLMIARGTDRIEIAGAFSPTVPVLIDMAAGRISHDRILDMSMKSSFFSLAPGSQSLTVTLVSATPATLVRLTYRERYRKAI